MSLRAFRGEKSCLPHRSKAKVGVFPWLLFHFSPMSLCPSVPLSLCPFLKKWLHFLGEYAIIRNIEGSKPSTKGHASPQVGLSRQRRTTFVMLSETKHLIPSIMDMGWVHTVADSSLPSSSIGDYDGKAAQNDPCYFVPLGAIGAISSAPTIKSSYFVHGLRCAYRRPSGGCSQERQTYNATDTGRATVTALQPHPSR